VRLIVRRCSSLLLGLAVFGGSFVWLASGIRVSKDGDSPPFFIDEAHKIAETYYWHLFFEQRDCSNPAWSGDFYARTNPPVGKYIFGAVLAAAGYHVRDQQLQESFDRHWKQPMVLRTKVPDEMLRITRMASAAFGALACGMLFLIGHRIGGIVVGLGASLLLLLNPYFQFYARLGLTDAILIFGTVLIVPVTFRAVSVIRRSAPEACPRGRARRWAHTLIGVFVLPALAIALTAGSRLNGALVGVAYCGSVLSAGLGRGQTPRWARRVAVSLIAAATVPVLAAAVFVAINPYYYRHPVARAIETARACRDWTIKQQVDPGGGLFDTKQRLAAVGHFTLRSQLLPLPAFVGTLGTWLTVLGFVVGVICLAARVFYRRRAGGSATSEGHDRDRLAMEATVVLWWMAACVGGTVCWLPLVWRRYLLFPYSAVCLMTAFGLASLPGVCQTMIKALKAGPRHLARRRPAVLVAAAATVSWAVLTFTSWVIAPELLLPVAMLDLSQEQQKELYESALRADAGSAIVHRNYGQLLMQLGMRDEAIEHFQTSLDLLSGSPRDAVATTVQRGRLLYDLARLKAASGDRAGAVRACEEFRRAVQTLRAGMKSSDSKVREEFDLTIADCQRWLADRGGVRRAEPNGPAGHSPEGI
jgi:hypothetical protein